MLTLANIKIKANETVTPDRLRDIAAKILRVKGEQLRELHIVKQSIDARDKTNVQYVITVGFYIHHEERYLRIKNVAKAKGYSLTVPKAESKLPPVVVGFGPGGMLAALVLAKAGLKPIVIERGKAVEERQRDIKAFWQGGHLNPGSNVQFGEGGAGTFSDGKLNTGKNDPLIAWVFKAFVQAGAPKEIMYMAKPHIGTDNLIIMVKNLREYIKKLGGRVLFQHQLTALHSQGGRLVGITCQSPKGQEHIACSSLILAPGHSARDTFEMLYNRGIAMEQKPFAMGVRIEHSQQKINRAQYGRFAKFLPAADYKLVAHLPDGRSLYTFCMCPGGYVVAAASEKGGLVTNGMSYFSRGGENANAALLVGLTPQDYGSDHPLAGVKLQRQLEQRAFLAGGSNYYAPVQLVGDILKDVPSTATAGIKPTYRPGVTPCSLRQVLPEFMYNTIAMGITQLDKQLQGFADPEAVLTAMESRSSSPVRIIRHKDSLESPSLKGLYPCGEGCGYAGGIVSAAVDGVKCALALCESLNKQ